MCIGARRFVPGFLFVPPDVLLHIWLQQVHALISCGCVHDCPSSLVLGMSSVCMLSLSACAVQVGGALACGQGCQTRQNLCTVCM
jgi:hypothetical protein